MNLGENEELMLIRLSEEKEEFLKNYGIAFAFLHDTFSRNYDEIVSFTGKKFIGSDSRPEVVLDWGYKQGGDIQKLIVDKYQDMVISGKRAEGLTSRIEALQEAMRFQTSKWKNEREMTR